MSAPDARARANKRLAGKLFLVVVAMFAFGFALVPLYDVFCQITGLNGNTGQNTSCGGKKATTQVWEGAEGLEWTVPSPAPYHTFATPPKVS